MIKVVYRSIDGYREGKRFVSVKGARSYAHKMVGEHPEIGSTYAVSGDGIGKVTVEGLSLAELFPSNEPVSQARGYRSYEQMQGDCGIDDEGPREELDSNGLPLHRTLGCTCSVMQLERVGCDCRLMDEMPSYPGLPLDM